MKDSFTEVNEYYKEALFWKKEGAGAILCTLCPRSCVITPGNTGACKTRKNIDGKLASINYGLMCAAIDQIEKKPLFHWRPGSSILSIGSFGCNLFCPFCQNYHLSRAGNGSGLQKATPRDILSLAFGSGLDSVAFTYNEPTVWFEFVLETALLLKSHRIATVIVTNGYISSIPREELLGFTDAINIDLKGFSDETYSRLGGSLEPVLETIFSAYKRGVHLEITHLVVPGINDSMVEFRSMIQWIKGISPDIPLHISRYFPACDWDRPPTPGEEIFNRVQAALEELNYVYIGNLGLDNDTKCPYCGKTVISRSSFGELDNLIGTKAKCPFCNTPLGIVTK